jgi:hypothetical protein
MSTPAFSSPPSETTTLDALTDLALDLRWSFNHSADKLWERLDPDLWISLTTRGSYCRRRPKKNCRV